MNSLASHDQPPTNRLIHELSPYLRQHANNPVDWYPWCDAALALARKLDKPIFLSIGYSACHWCHVMEHESFQDVTTAAIMNEHFVNIKVDREERPDLDQIYMAAVNKIAGRGGWPMSVWLTPDLKPFFAGTYFPPTRRHNLPSFPEMLQYINHVWQTRREEIHAQSAQLVEAIQQELSTNHDSAAVGDTGVTEDVLVDSAQMILRACDKKYGGLGTAPKFPHSVEMRLLMRGWKQVSDDRMRDMALLSLGNMVRGGLFDQVGGGFHRYSTDSRWLVPHFEKMLYDNALIAEACVEAWQVSRDPVFRRGATRTLDYVWNEMTDPLGGFYSSQDADSEGVEGKFYVWSKSEIEQLLGNDAGTFCKLFDVTTGGNWEGSNILNLPIDGQSAATAFNLSEQALDGLMNRSLRTLYQARSSRIPPGRDDKILTAWNGMMINTFAVAGKVFGEPRYVAAARKAAEFILQHLADDNRRLKRVYNSGEAKLNAYLEDYAYLANGLISLFEATCEPRWLIESFRLVQVITRHFADEAGGGFFFTSDDHETLISRAKDARDGATPAGTSMAGLALVRLAKWTDQPTIHDQVKQLFARLAPQMARDPIGSAMLILAHDQYLRQSREIVIVPGSDGGLSAEVATTMLADFQPEQLVMVAHPHAWAEPNLSKWLSASSKAETEIVETIRSKLVRPSQFASDATVYVCEHFACQQPMSGQAMLESLARNNH